MPKKKTPLTRDEIAKMKKPHEVRYSHHEELKIGLYHQLVREFLDSKKIGTRDLGRHREKIENVCNRYLPEYDGELDADQVIHEIRNAYYAVTGQRWMGSIGVDSMQDGRLPDRAAAAKKRAWATTGASLAASGASKAADLAGVLDSVGAAATGGVLSIFTAARSIRIAFKAANRAQVAQEFSDRYYVPGESPETRLLEPDREALGDDDCLLGDIAHYAAGNTLRLTRRHLTRVAGGLLSAVGAGLTIGTAGVAAPVGVPLVAAGTAIALEPTAEGAARAGYKASQGTKGQERREWSALLWHLGAEGHRASREFMVEMGILDKAEELIGLGFFDEENLDTSVKYIMRKLRSS